MKPLLAQICFRGVATLKLLLVQITHGWHAVLLNSPRNVVSCCVTVSCWRWFIRYHMCHFSQEYFLFRFTGAVSADNFLKLRSVRKYYSVSQKWPTFTVCGAHKINPFNNFSFSIMNLTCSLATPTNKRVPLYTPAQMFLVTNSARSPNEMKLCELLYVNSNSAALGLQVSEDCITF